MSETRKSKLELCAVITRLKAELAMEKKANIELSDMVKDGDKLALASSDGVDGLWDWHLNSNVVYYSPRWKSMLGYEEHELASNIATWEDLVHPDDEDNALKSVEAFLSGHSDCFEVDMRMRHKQGRYIYIRSRGIYLKSDSNSIPSRLIGTHVDISERKNTELFERRHTQFLKMIA